MTINEILDNLEDVIESAWNLPLTGGKCVVPVEKVLDLINDVRLNLPKELKQAKMIVVDRKDIIDDARKEAEQIIAVAQKRARHLVSENEITRQAQERANQMLTSAHSQSLELKKMTSEYVEQLLSTSEVALSKSLQDLKSAHAQIRRTSKKK